MGRPNKERRMHLTDRFPQSPPFAKGDSGGFFKNA